MSFNGNYSGSDMLRKLSGYLTSPAVAERAIIFSCDRFDGEASAHCRFRCQSVRYQLVWLVQYTFSSPS